MSFDHEYWSRVTASIVRPRDLPVRPWDELIEGWIVEQARTDTTITLTYGIWEKDRGPRSADPAPIRVNTKEFPLGTDG